MATNAELQAEVDRLNSENDALAEENERLEKERDEALAVPVPNTPKEPSYGLTEGNRQELEAHGYTVSPFTGARLLADVSEDGQVSNVREVSQDEFDKAVKASHEARQPVDRGTSFPKAS